MEINKNKQSLRDLYDNIYQRCVIKCHRERRKMWSKKSDLKNNGGKLPKSTETHKIYRFEKFSKSQTIEIQRKLCWDIS